MQIKEAIAWFKTKLAVNQTMGFKGEQNETSIMAIQALQEQLNQEEQQKSCCFCELFFKNGSTLEVNELLKQKDLLPVGQVRIIEKGIRIKGINAKYCPNCGKKLVKE